MGMRRARARLGFLLSVAGSGLMLSIGGAACTREYESTSYPEVEAGPQREASPITEPQPTCPSLEPVDPKKLPWKVPTPTQEGKCQADDITAMKDFLVAEPNATNEELEAFVKNRDATCHGCIFGDAKGTTWPPVPLENNKVLTFNVGACYALVTGLQACGQAVQNEWDCEFEACAQCSGQDELQTCRAKARTTTCKSFQLDSHTRCAGAPSADGICGGPFDSIRVQCQTATPPGPDGGADAKL